MSLSSILARLLGSWLFGTGARLYNWMTANTVWQESCARLLQPISDKSDEILVLDLGIGPGVSTMYMGINRPRTSFVGLDISHRMLKQARAGRDHAGWPAERLMLIQADVAHLPLSAESLDVAAGHSFLYLLPDHGAALREASRIVRQGGFVSFMEPSAGRPNWGWLLKQRSMRLLISLTLWRVYNWIHGRFSPASLVSALEQAGFSEVDTERALGGFGLYGRARKR